MDHYFVCVLTGCNRETPTILDVVSEDKLDEFITKVNSGVKPSMAEEYLEEIDDYNDAGIEVTVNELVDVKVYDILNPAYQTLNQCCHCRKTLHCVRKEDKEIYDIIRGIEEQIM